MIAGTLVEVIGLLITVVTVTVIVQFVLSLLISFNVVSLHNDVVASLWRALNAILDPILTPIRRILPDTGMIDFSPMVLLILLRILGTIIAGLA